MIRKVLILAAVAMLLPTVTAMAYHPSSSCDSCHLVHKADDGEGMPLWSGKAPDVLPNYINYSSDKMDALVGDPAGSTLLCLSCHDGADGLGIVHEGGEDGDLTRSHPIEFTYDGDLAVADGELVDPDTQGSSGLIGGKGTISEDLLFGGEMKCSSCHEIHANGLHEQVFGEDTPEDDTDDEVMDMPHLQPIDGIRWSYSSYSQSYRLRYGDLCTTCHIK